MVTFSFTIRTVRIVEIKRDDQPPPGLRFPSKRVTLNGPQLSLDREKALASVIVGFITSNRPHDLVRRGRRWTVTFDETMPLCVAASTTQPPETQPCPPSSSPTPAP